MEDDGIVVLSLFDGMSAGQVALREAGIKVKAYYASEIDKYAMQVTMANFPNTIQLGDVTQIDTSILPKIDLLIGGSPCQSFSFAGKQKGMATKCEQEILSLDVYLKLKEQGFEFEGQSYLFWEYMRIKHATNPDYFFLENVLMSEKWRKVLTQAIGINSICINSSLLSAQNRERLYWTNIGAEPAGLFDDLACGIKQPKDRGILLRDVLEKQVSEKYYLSDKMLNYLNTRKENYNGGKINYKTGEDVASCINACSGSLDISDNIIVDNPEDVMRSMGNPDKSYCLDATYHKGTSVKDYLNKKKRQLVNDESQGVPEEDNRIIPLDHHYSSIGLNCVGAIGKEKKWIEGDKNLQRNFSQGYRIYSPDGKCPTLSSQSGGPAGNGNTLITDNGETESGIINPLKNKSDYGWHFEQNVYSIDSKIRALKSSEGSGNKPKVIIENEDPQAVAMRGRQDEYGKWIQQIEPRTDGKTNSLTTVEKDNLIIQAEKDGVIGSVNDSQSGIVYGTGGKSASLCANGGGMGAKTGLYLVTGESKDPKTPEAEHFVIQTGKIKQIGSLYGQHSRWAIYAKDGLSPTITASMGMGGGHVPMIEDGDFEAKGITMSGTFGNRKVATSDKAYCLAANPSSDMQPMVEVTKIDTENTEDVSSGTLRTHKDGNGFREVKSGKGATVPARAREDGSGQNVVKIMSRIRRLTPVECERLQTFPDGYSDKGISDTQRYKMLGNSWTVEVIKYIFGHLPYPSNAHKD